MSSSFYKKDLLYSSYDEFIKASESFDFSKFNFNNPKICNSLMNLFDQGNTYLKLDDDEKGYIYLMRFVEGVLKLRGSKFYKDDKNYVESFIPSDKLMGTMSKLENLKKEIKTRYFERDQKLLEEKKALEDAKKELNSNLNSKETSLNINKTSVSCKELIELVNKPSQKNLIIDLRTKNEFNSSHMNLNLILSDARKRENSTTDYINIPSEMIETVSWKLSESLKKYDVDISKKFESRHSYDYLIIFDNDSDSKPSPDSKLSIFKRAIFDFDDKKLKNEPIILEGGWSKWISFYPGFTQYSKNFIPTQAMSKSDSINKTLTIKDVLDFDYPEINDLKKKSAFNIPINPPPNNLDTSKVPVITPSIHPQPTDKSASTPTPTAPPISDKTTLNTLPTIPNVNRSTKPSNVNIITTHNDSNTSKHSNDITPSTSSSSSDDEEDRKIFENNAIFKPESKDTSNESNDLKKQQTIQPNFPISTSENQNILNNSLDQRVKQMNVNPDLVKVPLTSISAPILKPEEKNLPKTDSNLDEKIYSTVYAPLRFNQLFQTPHMKNGAKILDKNTGLFSYQPVDREIISSPATANKSSISDKSQVLLNQANTIKEIKFVPPRPFKDTQKENKEVEAPKNPTTIPLNDDFSSSVNKSENSVTNLKRTFSSPNIAKLDEEILDSSNDRNIVNENSKDFLKSTTTRILAENPPTLPSPKAWNVIANNLNTNTKPMQPRVNRNNKPMPDHVINSRIDDLQPVYGNVPQGLTGIRNFGNTCFMNSILQCLISTQKLVDFFLKNTYKNDLNRSNDLGFKGEIADEFCVIVKAMWGGHCRIISPYRLRSTIGEFNQQFISNDQQDSQELLLFLLDGLHEDLNRVDKRPKITEKDDENENITDREAAKRSWNIHLSINNSIIVDLFQGQFKSTVTCLSCQKKSVKFDAFMYLTLPLLAKRCNLYECLDLFSQPENMLGESKWKCPKCKQYRNATKKIEIWKLPPLLIIHLKRFKYHGVWRDKITTMVDYPLENLNLENFVINKPQNKYRLYAISNHSGNLDGGHYTAMCRHFLFNKWYKFDDSNVKDISDLSTLHSPSAYILFYSQYS